MEIEQELEIKVRLHYKVIFRGRKRDDRDNKGAIREIHINLDLKGFSRNVNLHIA